MPQNIAIAIPAGVLLTIARWVMPPVIEFGSPVQRGKDTGESYWHIPLTIVPYLRRKWGPATLGLCQVYLDRYRGQECYDKIRLAWGDLHFEEPRPEERLEKGRAVLVPIARRVEEGNDRQAYIADLNFVRGEGQAKPVEADRIKNYFRLRVKCGKKEWASPHFYIIRVPRDVSNGQFAVEIIYEGEGTQGT